MGEQRSFAEIAGLIRDSEVGRRATIATPYGRRLICYADLTATGRFLRFVENWIHGLRPYYANTHTAISSTGRLMVTAVLACMTPPPSSGDCRGAAAGRGRLPRPATRNQAAA